MGRMQNADDSSDGPDTSSNSQARRRDLDELHIILENMAEEHQKLSLMVVVRS